MIKKKSKNAGKKIVAFFRGWILKSELLLLIVFGFLRRDKFLEKKTYINLLKIPFLHITDKI